MHLQFQHTATFPFQTQNSRVFYQLQMSTDVHNRRSSDSIAKLFIKIDRSGSGPHPNTKHTAHNPGDIVTGNESSKDRRQ